MGREAQANVIFGAQAGLCTLLLEADALIWRGAHRGRLARGDITSVTVAGDVLHIGHPSGPLAAELGASLAATWAKAIVKPPASLAQKLGLAKAGVRVLGPLHDADLASVCAAHSRTDAPLLIAQITSAQDMAAAFSALGAAATGALWAVSQKGKAAPIGDTAIRSYARAHGFIDSKSCAVSTQWTATRYGLAKQGEKAG